MTVSRSTISFTEQNWKQLVASPNKSKTVNVALNFFFESKKLLKEKEENFLLDELRNYENTGEGYSFEETFK